MTYHQSCDTHLSAISKYMLKFIIDWSWKIINSRLQLHPTGANELIMEPTVPQILQIYIPPVSGET